MRDKYIIEVRDAEDQLDLEAEKLRRQEHPYLFSKPEFTIDNLCYYASYGQDGVDNPIGPMKLDAFMQSIGVRYRVKTW